MNNKIENQLHDVSIEFVIAQKNNYTFLILSDVYESSFNLMVNKVFPEIEKEFEFAEKNNIQKHEVSEGHVEFLNLLETYNNNHKALEDQNKTYDHILHEKVFIDQCKSIEKLLYDYFYILFNNFPKFLVSNKQDTVQLKYNSLFEDSNLESIRENVIHQKVKGYIQSNNIYDTLKKFETVFKIKFDILKLDLNELFRMMQIRNIIMHNQGQINQIYIDNLTQKGIDVKFNLGDFVFPELFNEIERNSELFDRIWEKLMNSILQDIPRIKIHHEKK